jgi:hypothetical protein
VTAEWYLFVKILAMAGYLFLIDNSAVEILGWISKLFSKKNISLWCHPHLK